MSHAGTALIDPYKVFEKVGLTHGMRVADFGCGRTGHFVFPSAKIVGENGIVYAIDVVQNILESIKSLAKSEGYDNVQVIWSDVECVGKTPIPENSLNACFFVNLLSQVKDRWSTIKEAVRLLKSGSFLAIIDWSKKLGPLGPSKERLVSPDSIVEFSEENKLILQENTALSDYHFLLIFKKI